MKALTGLEEFAVWANSFENFPSRDKIKKKLEELLEKERESLVAGDGLLRRKIPDASWDKIVYAGRIGRAIFLKENDNEPS